MLAAFRSSSASRKVTSAVLFIGVTGQAVYQAKCKNTATEMSGVDLKQASLSIYSLLPMAIITVFSCSV